MLAMIPRKVRQMIALWLICVAVGAVIACHMHPVSPEHSHAMPGESHHSSSGYPLLDFACIGMAAVLPTVVIFALLLFQALQTPWLGLKHAGRHPLPFVPPRQSSR